ncbi:MAG TPA: dihydropteroate synthase [Bacteriovoracaceae bacterium]|nr:dihydropteroate synthase [Bacteriovoracaceae bacterium]
MNITPNSFSDGGELSTAGKFISKLGQFGEIDILDIGGESTAPQNDPVFHNEEWLRLMAYLPIIKNLPIAISIDTYHPETIFKVAQVWLEEKLTTPLIWNDVSGKFDQHVVKFLELRPDFQYVFCHNLAPIRELTGHHMEYVRELGEEEFLDEVASYFRPCINPQVIFDPCLGFSKSYQQNWHLLENFGALQQRVGHDRWLLGFSRKSFLRKRLGLEGSVQENREKLDSYHGKLLAELKPLLQTDLIIRSHRPELIS